MTGTELGVTGFFLREVNPHLSNIHCIAHKLALCSGQAAERVPVLKDYQTTLTSIFYYFKRSSCRVEKLRAVQELLDSPQLRIREVHQVRWLAIYQAVETIYRSLDALITFFHNEKDATAQGYAKKLSQKDFVHVTYLLMDVLPVITKLSLFFQRKDLDLPLIPVQVDLCIKDLQKLKDDGAGMYVQELEKELSLESGKMVFKGHVLQGRDNFKSVKNAFLEELIKNIRSRFPEDESNIINAYSVLGMRPISFIQKEQLDDWGNDQLEILVSKYGKEQQAAPLKKGATDHPPPIRAKALIDAQATMEEWSQLKPLVLSQGYPRDRFSTLWGLIAKFHGSSFPNLLKLAECALVSPVHTADCERAFSQQNLVKTSLRNRLSPQRVNQLMLIQVEGPAMADFDFDEALLMWKKQPRRLH